MLEDPRVRDRPALGGTATSRSSRNVIANATQATATAGRPSASSRNTSAGYA